MQLKVQEKQEPNLKLVEGIKINIKANITEIETKNQFKRSTKQS
jgi:hypothetical protein